MSSKPSSPHHRATGSSNAQLPSQKQTSSGSMNQYAPTVTRSMSKAATGQKRSAEKADENVHAKKPRVSQSDSSANPSSSAISPTFETHPNPPARDDGQRSQLVATAFANMRRPLPVKVAVYLPGTAYVAPSGMLIFGGLAAALANAFEMEDHVVALEAAAASVPALPPVTVSSSTPPAAPAMMQPVTSAIISPPGSLYPFVTDPTEQPNSSNR